ncbi:MAG: alpha/beta hydrolase [Deltaproteobacteria bacterium]|nr:alpha/beta hydrolase [Deltaproteobacteria bacterium]
MTAHRKTSALIIAVGVSLLASLGLADTAAKRSASGSPPTRSIVLVHGAFADASSWDRVIPLLQAKGYHVVAVNEPLTSLADDVAATNRVIDAQPGEVTLVGHSYGGVVISEAGNNPKVTNLVYVAAFAPGEGESANDLGKGQPPPPWVATLQIDRGGFASLPLETMQRHFAPDLPAAEAKVMAATQAPIAMANLDAKVTNPAWKTKPSWYVRAEQDRMVDPRGQAQTARRIGATLISVNASHVVMLSKPRPVADAILAAASAPAASQERPAEPQRIQRL